MFIRYKKFLYFPFASYFRFFARIRLSRWHPKIIVATGSNGKTTLLHLLESQIGDKAKYSHHANSSFGIPFDILDLHRSTLLKPEWISLFFKAPFQIFKKIPPQKIYVVEADCDRPGEGKFLGSFLKPHIVIWLNSAKTHSMNFEKLFGKKFQTVEEAIANEFGFFLEYAKDKVIVNADSELIKNELGRTSAETISLNKDKYLNGYTVNSVGSEFKIDRKDYKFNYLLPEDVFYSVLATKKLCEVLDISFEPQFSKFHMPPGRGSIFEGIKSTKIIDSSYNANLSSMAAVIEMFNKIPSENKWIVIGDMLEQGGSEREEHEKLAELLKPELYKRIILLGPRVKRYTFPKLKTRANDIPVDAFENPKDVLNFFLENLKGGEVILFKGARFMEGIIEHLLKNKSDVKYLPRREKIWDIRRSKWGL